jgi:cytochrome c-type biogenesis protein CcmI
MMNQFLLAAVVMLLVLLVVLVWPLRSHNRVNATRKELFAEKLALLVQARDSGQLADSDFSQAAEELKQQFVTDPTLVILRGGSMLPWRIAAIVSVLLVTVGVYLATGQYRQLQQWDSAKANLAAYGERALLGKGEPLTEAEIDEFALGLRTKLLQNDDKDGMGWFLLGRIWFSQGHNSDALEAFERALLLAPANNNMLLSYAQALLVNNAPDATQKAAASLGKVLATDPSNTDAISMLALMAQERGDYSEAKTAWELLLEQLDKNDPRYSRIEQQLTEVQRLMTPAKRSIVVNLTVDPALATANSQATLFVFAKAIAGSGMPLAVQKIPMFSGNKTITLTSQMQMQAGWSLDSVEQALVQVRLSRTGAIAADANDLAVSSAAISLKDGSQQISLTLKATD